MNRARTVATLNRVFCGIAFLMHGIPKVMNFEQTAETFSSAFGVPGWLAIPVGLLEFFGGIALILGFLSRPLAGAFILHMLAGIVKVHLPNGWDVFQGGYEYNLALIVLLIGVILLGPGRFSIDGAIDRRTTDGRTGEVEV